MYHFMCVDVEYRWIMNVVGISDRRKERLENTVSNRLNDLTIVAEGTHLRHNLSAMN